MSSSEFKVFVLGAIVVLGWLAVHVLRAWFAKPAAPDPWGREIAEALEQPDATPICSHCQCPHEENRWFCPEWGRAVGQFTSVMPPLYLFELGDSFREGTSGKFRVSLLTVAGFLFFGFAGFVLITPLFFCFPVYLWLFFKNLACQKSPTGNEPPIVTRG